MTDAGLQKVPDLPDFATRMTVALKCDGTENLQIYMGTTDERIEELKKTGRHKNPWGFLSYAPPGEDGSWTHDGVLWIAPPGSMGNGVPDWTKENHFFGIVLRELGWGFGNTPVPKRSWATISRTCLMVPSKRNPAKRPSFSLKSIREGC